MAKVVRLRGHEMREWHRNESMLVNENGEVVRPATSKEQLTMFQVSKYVAANGKPFQVKTPEETSLVEARLQKLPGVNKALVKFFIDNMEVKGGRELMRDRLLAEHGPCQVRAMNGKLIAMVRAPGGVQTPTTPGAALNVPDANSCLCQKWTLSDGRAHPGKHHPICQFNEQAPVEQRSSFDEDNSQLPATHFDPKLPVVQPAMPGKPVAVKQAPQPAPSIPAPEVCYCKDWNLANGEKKPTNVHHPVCEYKDKWESEHGEVYYLVDLDTLEPMREATAEEVKEGEQSEATGGVMLCQVGEKTYGLMLKSEIDAALASQGSETEEDEKPESD